MDNFNEEDVRKFYRFFKHKNATEIRVFDKAKYPNGKSVFVNNEDEFVDKCRFFNVDEGVNTYIGSRDRKGLGDKNVVSSHFILLENDEHDMKKPLEKQKVMDFMEKNNIKIGMMGMSGAGHHFYLPHKLEEFENEEKAFGYKENSLGSFKRVVLGSGLDIDPKVFNLERVMRVLGTYNFNRNKLSRVELIQNVDVEANTQSLIKLVQSEVKPKESIQSKVKYNSDDDELIKQIKEKWKVGDRQDLTLSLAGYLRKNRRLGLSSTLEIIKNICDDCGDNDFAERKTAIERTYNMDEQDIVGISGLKEKEIEVDKKDEYKPKYSLEQFSKSMKFFDDKDLLSKIQNEISKDHIGDDKLKMTLFLAEVSGLLKNPKNRVSCAVKGDSSGGKDNVMRSTLKHIPDEKFLFVTSATQASIEDDIQGKNILVLSELNSNRENGANKNLIEVIKQKTEGGTSAIKKDLRDGMKSSRHEISEQGTVIFSTTESQMDDEMKTRFLNLDITSTREKIKAVNSNTLDSFSDIDSLLYGIDANDSIIRVGLTGFCRVFDSFYIYLPYVKYLKDFSFIDDGDARSQRDLKRVLSLTCAMTFLNSRRRKTYQKKGVNFIESVPQDLIDTLRISKDFFNQSYIGLDGRLSKIIDFIKSSPDEWVERGSVQKEVGCKSLNTFKSYLDQLSMGGMGLIEGTSGRKLNELSAMNQYHNSKIYYKTCQKGVKKVFLTCQLTELKQYLINKIREGESTLDVDGVIPLKKEDVFEEIDTFSLTPFQDSEAEQ